MGNLTLPEIEPALIAGGNPRINGTDGHAIKNAPAGDRGHSKLFPIELGKSYVLQHGQGVARPFHDTWARNSSSSGFAVASLSLGPDGKPYSSWADSMTELYVQNKDGEYELASGKVDIDGTDMTYIYSFPMKDTELFRVIPYAPRYKEKPAPRQQTSYKCPGLVVPAEYTKNASKLWLGETDETGFTYQFVIPDTLYTKSGTTYTEYVPSATKKPFLIASYSYGFCQCTTMTRSHAYWYNMGTDSDPDWNVRAGYGQADCKYNSVPGASYDSLGYAYLYEGTYTADVIACNDFNLMMLCDVIRRYGGTTGAIKVMDIPNRIINLEVVNKNPGLPNLKPCFVITRHAAPLYAGIAEAIRTRLNLPSSYIMQPHEFASVLEEGLKKE